MKLSILLSLLFSGFLAHAYTCSYTTSTTSAELDPSTMLGCYSRFLQHQIDYTKFDLARRYGSWLAGTKGQDHALSAHKNKMYHGVLEYLEMLYRLKEYNTKGLRGFDISNASEITLTCDDSSSSS